MREHVITEGHETASEIVVGRAMTDELVRRVADRGYERVAMLCQPRTRDLAERYADAFAAQGFAASGYAVPDGEEGKQMSVVEDVYRHLNDHRFTRSDAIIGVGGGSLTDVAGFIAGTYLRGIDAMYVPTTLLGAVDAAIGGKTGVNVDGKNLAGVFKHPWLVVIDIDTLDALPEERRRDGSAEALKTGFIADMTIVEDYETSGLEVDLESIVNRSVAIKASVVNDDFTEQGRRAILNYGHTVGHGIESATGRSHGESVAIGMVAAGAASMHALGFTGQDRQVEALGEVGLPTAAPDADEHALRSYMLLDKKRDAAGLNMVLLRDFEAPEVLTVDDATVRAALASIGVG